MFKNDEGHPAEYIGDGVYATFDGFGIWLKANGPKNDDEQIYLEPEVLKALIEFNQKVRE